MPKSYVLLGVVAVVAFLLGYLVGVQKPTPTVAQTATAASIAPTTTTTQLTTPTAAATPKKIVIVDSAGRYVEITKPVTKIATLAPSVMEALAILNATKYIAGVSTSALNPGNYWNYVMRQNNISAINIGEWSKPNYEAIIQLRPQVVFELVGRASTELEEKLEPYGIKVVRVSITKPSSVVQEVKLLGLIFDREREAENYAKWVDKVMSIVNERLKGLKEEEKLTVYPEVFASPWTAHGPGSGLFEACTMAGLKPITSVLSSGLPRVSAEWVIQRNPDVVVKDITTGNLTIKSFEAVYRDLATRLSTTNAAKSGKIIVITYTLGNSLGYPVGVLYIAKVAYPDRFRDVDPNQYLCEFLQMIHLPCKGVWGYAGPNNPVLGWP